MKKMVILPLIAAAALIGCGQKDDQKPQFQPPVGQGGPIQGGPVQGFDKVKMLQELIAKDPKNLNALIELGNTLMDSQRFAEAADVYLKALEIDPKNADVRVDMGTCYKYSGKPDLALKEYKKALEHNPKHVNAHKNMGVVYANDMRDYKQALKEFELALSLAPNAPDAPALKAEIEKLKGMAK